MNSRKDLYPHQALLLLTPEGTPSTSADGEPYDVISYRTDVTAWLECAIEKVEATRVQETIAQYLDLIRKKKVNVSEEIQEFLSRPENLPIALEVAGQVEPLRDYVRSQFWRAVEQKLKQRLENSAYSGDWEIWADPRSTLEENWHLHIEMKTRLPDSQATPAARIALGQGSAKYGFNLRYGIAWRSHEAHPVCLRQYQALYDYLLALLAPKKLVPPKTGRWIFITRPGYLLRSDHFLLRMATDKDAFVREIVDLPWSLFENSVGLLTDLNHAV